MTIPGNIINDPAGHERFYRLDYPELFSGLVTPGGNIWVFPLDAEKPRKCILLITEDGNTLFHPEALAALLPEIRGNLIPPDREPAPSPVKTNDPAGQIQVETADKIRQYHIQHPSFQGILLGSLPAENGKTDTDFTERLSRMVSSFGSVLFLPPGNCLALFPGSMDGELLAHRLSKSLHTQVFFHFQADDPGTAIIQLGPYL
jgi:hypothetical protein